MPGYPDVTVSCNLTHLTGLVDSEASPLSTDRQNEGGSVFANRSVVLCSSCHLGEGGGVESKPLFPVDPSPGQGFGLFYG